MAANNLIDKYLEGWRQGDPLKSLNATAPGFYYDDPNTGRITRDGFIEFMESFKSYAATLCGGTLPSPFLLYTDIVIQEANGTSTTWCWWRVNGTEFQGSALIKSGSNGVLSEQIAYFTQLP